MKVRYDNLKIENSQKDLHVKVLPTTKFKTTTITLKYMAPLDSETMTARSILSKVLVRATKQWPSDKDFNRHLSHLYGAYVNSFVSKFKDKHVITISLELVNERYLKDQTPLFEKGLELLKEMIYNPLISDNKFDETFVAQEKSLLSKKLNAMIDNKSQISFLNLLKYMFGEQPYRHLATGQVEYIADITSENLYHTYQSMLENDYCAVYVVGNVDEQQVKSQIQTYFNINPFSFELSQSNPVGQDHHTPQVIVETDDVDQAKLNMGFKLPAKYGDPEYFAMIVFNVMFGGDPSSVLFNEVREKQSLAYSIHSQIDAKNGFLFVLSGVSTDKYEVAKETIVSEFEKFQQGDFEEEKIALAKKVILSQRQESHDRAKSIIEIMNNNILLDEPMSEESYISGIQNVKKSDIQQLAQATTLDTIYILTKGGDD
ncbi:EF-P 5-aminopentanol modification-associated protein YfmF [Staphylococcus pseudoxylosus]|uniref:Insulinase family protein n=1 Tax=Staphylococcus pseudoxylosus TaxID=2282419 RepID=A0AAQ0MHV2_9STAP|nr:pitrilysin family protein [Staphylococcus pseudoxylosus]PTI83155.1 peptidase M16 [Staphylococcus xylosus]MBM2658901.1 insulinase family protein [Staphylococcus pseudoxylosus]MCE5002803.1 insulinase family protein [Staphylococcus pseudoxylosus]MEB6169605.1 insulinase family protein [Staphylococcus pseudoxylosus]MEB6332133.1 insulinase family protein [Staphylococcus pseudoxylosus]